ncbi:aconitate hydratase AcnA [Burkholderia gladioli pv. gladioli]|uniref:Aconitate hydratase n=1 Tax=Burkholderia gladioli TaxID=28095 RepID=A0A095G2U0_BURGA|nr:aconitate hydratase AcnA [Burkholderia gladioli]AJX00753.1 aconitate hydratase 1 [Burkholderia gladioli]ASD79847.1 aconitate hydratase 1 [Burkholderia gladioli pv. gladioli]AWY54909.1 aconitate hydratase 1 [Burkholderia gladioli pv. gladioli]KGC11682.1 aconitate hydratase 1 [Burkholderia gladioli]MDJ1164104.1 aconitate hydratase AcnA [Burkholderia gladioli pv. gladioli]
MENTYTPSQAQLSVGGKVCRYVDLPTLFGDRLRELPVVLRLLLENVIRNMEGAERDQAIAAILGWTTHATSVEEIAFQPNRVLMHDTTSTPALVDIAGMRDALAEAGADPSALNPVLPVDSSVDHSLAVEYFARPDAAPENLKLELRRNAERYRFLRWAAKTLSGVRIHPPGTGIMHTINLEQLATVVTTVERDSETWAVPDTLIGTDSHTPMINGIGVLGWGVGGLEAQTVMFGMPVMQRIPDVIGVRLTGALWTGALATDLALTVTQRLREIGVSGEFVEFFGPGVSTLTAGDRAVVANMAPEYGASTGFFPVDQHTLAYLRATNRSEGSVRLVEAFTRAAGLWFDPEGVPRYSRTIDIDLSTIGMHISGPRRPQDLLDYSQTREVLSKLVFQPAAKHAFMPKHPIAIAAITSCTNTSDPALLIAAGLVARKARALGLKVPSWIKTSLGPGSPAAAAYLERAKLIDDLSAVGFDIVGYGCTTCIGNSGPLTTPIREAMAEETVYPVAMLSGNRNFPGRIHPDLDLGFIMSPPLVIAFALAGDAQADLSRDPVQHTQDGKPIYLRDLWPTRDEVAALVKAAADPRDYPRAFALASRNPAWHDLDAPETARFPWNPASTALRRPPFASASQGSQLGHYSAYPLLVLGDDVTTDHISPASAIPKDSYVADFLVERGDDRDDLNVFASRRGNWEVMVRAAFYNRTLLNRLKPGIPVAHTLHVPSGEVMPIFEAAQRYRDEGSSVVLVAGERYGTGSSRDWAAKGQRLLGIRAVLAMSFERIHRSNLIGMGILPLRFAAGTGAPTLNLQPGDKLEVDAPVGDLSPRCKVPVRIVRADGSVQPVDATAAVETQLECRLLRSGGVIPLILQQHLTTQEV